MEYKPIENKGIAYKAMEYMSNMKNAAKVAAVTGLAALVLATSGCARTSGGSASLLNLEWGDKTVFTKDEETKKAVINSDAKYEDTATVVPGKGLGVSYKDKD